MYVYELFIVEYQKVNIMLSYVYEYIHLHMYDDNNNINLFKFERWGAKYHK